MKAAETSNAMQAHSHNFLGTGHDQNERRTWGVIVLCSAMMLIEIVGGRIFGSLALVADGLHMSTHAGAMLIAALAYTYARRHANDSRFVFGTGKLGDLAGFSSAIVLAMIAVLIGYEAIARFLSPVPIRFAEAIPIAVVGLLVNIASAWLLSGSDHHGHSHGHSHPEHPTDSKTIETDQGPVQEIPEPHEFKVALHLAGGRHEVTFEEHSHNHGPRHSHSGAAHRDNNIRSAYVHVMADAAVSVLAITGLALARGFGWMWMDPLAGIIGAAVISNWSFGLARATGRILLDMNPDQRITGEVREAIEATGDRLLDLHLWRLGPGHLGAVISVLTREARDCAYYRALLKDFKSLSHVTVEVMKTAA